MYMYMYMYKYIQRQTKNRENTGGKPKVQKPTTVTTALPRVSYYFFLFSIIAGSPETYGVVSRSISI